MSTASKIKVDPETLPTAAQVTCLKTVHRLTRTLKRSPSIREVSAELGLSPMGARRLILVLVRKGLMEPPKVVVRTTMRVTPAGKRWL